MTSKAPLKEIFEICRIGLGLGRSLLPCRHVITQAGAERSSAADDRACSARFRLGNALCVEVQPADSPEVRIWEIAGDLQTDPLPHFALARVPRQE